MLVEQLKEISGEYQRIKAEANRKLEEGRKLWCNENFNKYIDTVDKSKIVHELLSEARLGGVIKKFSLSDIARFADQNPEEFIQEDLIKAFCDILIGMDNKLVYNVVIPNKVTETEAFVAVAWE